MDFAGIGLTILKAFVFIGGLLDAYKYKFMTLKVSRLKSSKEISRKFLNASIFNRIILLIYVWFILHDMVLTVVSVIALYTMCESFYYVYLHYPYRNRGLKNFKRPSLLTYTLNSLQSHKKKRRL
jgi:hypothetical protein